MEDVRRYVKAGLGALTPPGPPGTEDVASTLISVAQGAAEQFSTLAASFLLWSSEARASLLREVKDAVARQVRDMGLATREDVEALMARIEKLEREVAKRTPSQAKPRQAAKQPSSKSRTRQSAAKGKSSRPPSGSA